MASFSTYKALCHARSISLPSRPHPIADQFDEHLCRLRSSQAASTSSSSLSRKFSILNDLYHCVDELLRLPLNQQALSQSIHAKWAEDVLDGSLRLLDICDTSKSVLQLSQESLQDIQSVLRRKFSGELSVTNEVVEYLNNRKKAKSAIKKCLKSVKEADKDGERNGILSMLKDAEAITVDILKSLLSYIAGAKSQSNKSGWSKIAKLVHQSGNEDAAAPASAFAAVDSSLDSLICHKKKCGIDMSQVEILRSKMIKLESEIQDVNEELESLSRHLVKTRATLLNIFSN